LKDKANMIPNEVVGAIVKMDKTPLQAWREYFQISEQELSVRLGISEMELVKMEKQPNHKKSSLKIFAATLGLNVEQLNI
jgi:predicted transcriptional regulator